MSGHMFETERLYVRHFIPEDLNAFAALCADSEVMKYVGDGSTLHRDQVSHWIDVCQQKYAERGYGTSAVFEKATDRFIGYCGVIRAPDRDFDELVYVYHAETWGKGYATEAGRAMIDYVFARSGLDCIYATVIAENGASIRVAEKLGFTFERQVIDDDGTPVNYYVTRRGGSPGIVLRLPYRPPYNWPMMLAFLENRTIPGVEWVQDGRYGRTFLLNGHSGWLEVRHDPDNIQLIADVHTSDVRVVPAVTGRLRRLFDLDTDMGPVEAALAADPLLTDKVQLHPGLRMPGAWDEFELGARAILGQQVSVAAARTLAGRLAAQFGQPLPAGTGVPAGDGASLVFPTPTALVGQDLTTIGLPQARARALAGLAAAVADDADLLSPFQNPRQAVARLVKLPGIGPWTAEYIAMRALRDTDAFPASDLGLLIGAAAGGPRPKPAELTRRAEQWRPWRAYAAIHLWTMPVA